MQGQRSQESYGSLVNSVEGVIWEAELLAYRFTFVSQYAERLLGYPLERWTAEPNFWISHLHPEDVGWAVAYAIRASAGQRPYEFKYRMIAADGRTVWLRDIVTVVHDNQGAPRLRGLMVDVSRQAQLEADLRERASARRQSDAVLSMSVALRAAQSRADMPAIVLDQLLTLLPAKAAALTVDEPDTGEMQIELTRGPWKDHLAKWLTQDYGLHKQDGVEGQLALYRAAPLETSLDQTAEPQLVVCAQLAVQQQAIGALWLAHDADLAESDGHLLRLLADVAASAMHRSALHEQTARRLNRLQALRAIDISITSGLDLNASLSVILDQVLSQLELHAAAILVINRHSQALENSAARGFKSGGRGRPLPRPADELAAQVLRQRSTVQLAGRAATGEAAWGVEEGFVTCYGVPLVANGRVTGVLEVFHRAPLHPDAEWLDFLETLAGQAAIAVEHTGLFEDLRDSNSQLILSYDATIAGWSRALDMRDRDTEGHAERVAELTVRLARAMGVPDGELVHIYRGALLHDIGKMGVPDNVLLKPGPLTDEEWKIMRRHPVNAYTMLAPIAHLQPALPIPYCHHERWDGTGYPRGLQGAEIPLPARIFAAVDVWDALCADRPYRAGWPPERVRQYIRSEAGSHFDPQVVEAFLALMAEAGLDKPL